MNQPIDEILPFTNLKLSPEEAMDITIKFREKYHLGKAERVIPSPFITMHRSKLDRDKKTYNVPPDIAKFRLEHYGEQFERFPLVWGFMVLTWGVFPPRALPTNWWILHHSEFQSYETLYISVWSSGEDVYQTSPKALQAFFEDKELYRNNDYYIFPADLTWCIAITHENGYIFVPRNNPFTALDE